MTLWFIGAGLGGANSLSEQAKNVITESDIVFVEQFTSPTGIEFLNAIEKFAPGRVHAVKRWTVEDGKKILDAAKEGTASLVSWGDSYAATTHIELRVRAASFGTKTRTVHGVSALTAMVGECGLHQYKVGRTVTIMDGAGTYDTAYYTIYDNMVHGSHTILLLEYNQDKNYFLNPAKALEILQGAENGQRRRAAADDIFCIVASRIGANDQKITAGKISTLAKSEFGKPPHAIIIPGSMHFTESDALQVLAECLDEPTDNSQSTPSIPKQMIKKYVPIISKAIEDARKLCNNDARFEEILDGATRYTEDAERFLEQGQEDLAVLCIGYADGLADAVRIAHGLEPAGASDKSII